MNPDSIFFLSCFFPLCLGAYFLVPRLKGKNIALLLLGLLFYSFGSLPGVGVLLLSALVNYLLGLALEKYQVKWLLAIGVAANLLFLGVYKYLDFFLSGVLGLPQLEMGIAAPLGISFYTFKSISYLIDTCRDKTKAARSYGELLLYLSFFPQVMAGPITRFCDFGPQLETREITMEKVCTGIRRFVAGLGKKVILAGTLGAVVDKVFGFSQLDARLAWLGAVGYCLQIYFDFSGYSDMAIGLGQVFGFATPENFNHPYIAPTIGDFWRRWHISLSAWFRDYLYIPLGGNRKGKARAALNKGIVFTLCGLWHGASWNFLVWGAWHGVLSAFESAVPVKKLTKTKPGRAVGHIYTLLAVCLGFVMFRAETLLQGFEIIAAMFTGFSATAGATVLLHRLLTWETAAVLVLGTVLSLPVKTWLTQRVKHQKVLEISSYICTLVLFVLCIAKLAAGGFAPFIYTQF